MDNEAMLLVPVSGTPQVDKNVTSPNPGWLQQIALSNDALCLSMVRGGGVVRKSASGVPATLSFSNSRAQHDDSDAND